MDDPGGSRWGRTESLGARRFDCVVIGGGITGAAATYYLAKSGADVALVERFDLNTEASGRNAGSLHGQIQFPSFVERGEDWGRKFIPGLAFLHESLAVWRSLSTELGADLEVVTDGGLLIAESEAQMGLIEQKVAIERAAGFDVEMLGREDLVSLAPYVADSMIGGELAHGEGVANPLLAAPAFVAAADRLGASIFTDTEVLAAERRSGGLALATTRGEIECERVVLAAGSGIRSIAETLGFAIDTGDEAVQLAVTEPMEPFVRHLVYFAGGALTFKQAKAGSLLIGGGWPAAMDPTTHRPRVSAHSLRHNLRIAQRVVPRIGSAKVVRSWAGVDRNTPDLLPIIGAPSGWAEVLVGVFPHMGFTAGPLMGRTLAEMALGQRPGVDVAPFAPQRFAAL